MGLSEKRARAVAKELIDKYGVSSDQITIEWKGSDEQPYDENNWNRVVIMRAAKEAISNLPYKKAVLLWGAAFLLP